MTGEKVRLYRCRMNHSPTDLRTLARAYLDATGMGVSTLSRKITGATNSRTGNEKLIRRVLAGHDCTMSRGEAAWSWFEANWPEGTPWPASVARCICTREAAE